MKKSDIYEIAIKILGLYLVTTIIQFLKEILAFTAVLAQYQNNPSAFGHFNQIPLILVSVFNLLLVIVFAGLLIFKTKKLTKLICQKEDFVETAKLFTDKKTIVEIALIIVGLLTIIWTVPEFAIKLKNYIQLLQNDLTVNMQDTSFFYISGLKIVIGIIAVYYAKSISSFISTDTKEKKEEEKE